MCFFMVVGLKIGSKAGESDQAVVTGSDGAVVDGDLIFVFGLPEGSFEELGVTTALYTLTGHIEVVVGSLFEQQRFFVRLSLEIVLHFGAFVQLVVDQIAINIDAFVRVGHIHRQVEMNQKIFGVHLGIGLVDVVDVKTSVLILIVHVVPVAGKGFDECSIVIGCMPLDVDRKSVV